MALFNYATKEITLKIVYYGPGLSGKTTNLQYLHSILNPQTKGRLLSLSTEAERTLFFDFLPVELGKIRDFSIRFQLYTVPGQVRYNATRKIVLKGADAVVFVADSQRELQEQNVDSLSNMRDNLLANSINPDEIPIIFQYNKRDLKNISSVDELNVDLNSYHYSFMEASAINGTGVEDSFKLITKLLLRHISRKHEIEIQPSREAKEKELSEVIVRSAVPMTADFPLPVSMEKPRERIPIWEPEEPEESIALPHVSDKTAQTLQDEGDKGVLKATREVPPESLNAAVDEIRRVYEALTDLRNSVSSLHREIKILKDIKKGHEETNAILRDLLQAFEDGRTRKSWFRF
jgi:mutual gliding-motility protein MglA